MMDADPNFLHAILSGRVEGAAPTIVRGVLRIAEPFYATAMRLRNWMYDSRTIPTHDLGRPTIAVGNITTGGTGKTPLVRWAAEQLRTAGIQVGILSRGYGSTRARPLGDELTMLSHQLNDGRCLPIPLIANPDRVRGAVDLLANFPLTQAFLLDDGFQHRRVKRTLNIVLINATEPFGFGHVLPRGLLREPLAGLRRADAVVLTHVNRVNESAVSSVESQIAQFNPNVPIYHASHQLNAVLTPSGQLPLDALQTRSIYGFCGIGTPAAFDRDISELAHRAGFRAFDDHHAYVQSDIEKLDAEALAVGADVLLTTEKDWVKLAPLVKASLRIPIWRVDMKIVFRADHEARLLRQILDAIGGAFA